jgi:hypothetical protein
MELYSTELDFCHFAGAYRGHVQKCEKRHELPSPRLQLLDFLFNF